ncbi:hypothetical protein AGABI1DRAFT_133388 [Agaricus bisporus var. burnettii JB137-S8]|uniref:Uncharacterized protein n=1 Tax=Agaricus bisporus var. burnettii (strain JB137-S8 / ATCC MYA-4627 / FGSC 10392) TaxID=597362 RepID=K5VIZ8_AGABU|nr:hypothetical protein AGABI1DRAFT_133388 [Agaricus bisporus var. burnettii JB137-S8]
MKVKVEIPVVGSIDARTRTFGTDPRWSMVKPEETLVEARSDSDVQIDRQIWV